MYVLEGGTRTAYAIALASDYIAPRANRRTRASVS